MVAFAAQQRLSPEPVDSRLKHTSHTSIAVALRNTHAACVTPV
jgi:hypothetical protein